MEPEYLALLAQLSPLGIEPRYILSIVCQCITKVKVLLDLNAKVKVLLDLNAKVK
jgi:hypothetical protein